MLAPAILFAFLVPARPVRIEAAPNGDALRARLAARLLEEGHLIVPPSGRGGISIRIDTSSITATIEVAGRQSARARFPLKSQLAELELLHFASTSLEAVGEPATPRSDELRVAIDLADVDGVEEVHARALLGLLDAGFAVAGSSAVHEAELCLRSLDGDLAVWSVRGRSCERAPPEGSERATADQIRTVAPRAVKFAPAQKVAIAPRESPAVAPESDPLRIEARVSGGATVGPIGPIVGLSLGLGLSGWIGGTIETLLSSSSASGEGRIYELWTVAGPALPLRIADPLQLRLAVVGGLLWHRFQLDRVGGGDRFDAALLGSIRLAWMIHPSYSLEAAVLGGASTRARVHTVDGAEVWRREPWFFALLLGIGWGHAL